MTKDREDASNGGRELRVDPTSHNWLLAALLGFSMLLSAMILDDLHDAVARAVIIRGTGGSATGGKYA